MGRKLLYDVGTDIGNEHVVFGIDMKAMGLGELAVFPTLHIRAVGLEDADRVGVTAEHVETVSRIDREVGDLGKGEITRDLGPVLYDGELRWRNRHGGAPHDWSIRTEIELG